MKLGPAKQTLSWTTKGDTIGETVPGILTQLVTIGSRGYRLLLSFDENGVFHPALDFERTAFVVRSGKLTVRGPGQDAGKLALLLADPNFSYEARRERPAHPDPRGHGRAPRPGLHARSAARPRSRRTRAPEPWSSPSRRLKDTAAADRIVKLSYQSGKGTMALGLADLDLSGISPGEAHLGFELTIGTRTYYTAVTFFETSGGRYSTTMP